MVANVNRTKGDPFSRDDFLPHPVGSREERPAADLASRVRAGGGVVMALPALVSVSSDGQRTE